MGNKASPKESLKVNREESVDRCPVSRCCGNFQSVDFDCIPKNNFEEIFLPKVVSFTHMYKVGLCEPSDALSS